MCGRPAPTAPARAPRPCPRLQGNRRTLQFDDLFAIPDALTTGKVYPEFSAQFKRQVAAAEAGGDAGAARLEAAREGTTSRFVLHSIWHAHKVRLLCALVLQVAYSGIQFAGPLMLNQIIKFLSLPPAAETVRARAHALGRGGSSCLRCLEVLSVCPPPRANGVAAAPAPLVGPPCLTAPRLPACSTRPKSRRTSLRR